MTDTMASLIAAHELFEAMSPEATELIAGCSHNVAFGTDDVLVAEGEEATTFYIIRRGHVALEVHRPGSGPLTIETLGPGAAVGWSWLFPPHRWHLDARALEPVGAIAIDGQCLRTKAENDPQFGYPLIKRFASVMLDHLMATQLRLLDVYGDVGAHAEVVVDVSEACLVDAVEPFVPRRYRVVERRVETDDVSTIVLEPTGPPGRKPRAGQFNMLSAFGIGEVAISVSGTRGDLLEHTIRAVGAVSRALAESNVGAVVGVRGPFGTNLGADDVGDADVVIVAGGIGLAPLRGVVTSLVEGARTPAGRLFVLIGARTPDDVVFSRELESWRASGAYVAVTVDAAERARRGRVGLVTSLVPAAPFDAAKTIAMVCGPEVMMRYAVRALVDRGVDAASILVSLERNMQCGIGLCGHCQLGPLLLCRDGPIVSYRGVVSELLLRREL